jgi:hypothetical protein
MVDELRLLEAAETVLAAAYESYPTGGAGDRFVNDLEWQFRQAARVCREHVAALRPYLPDLPDHMSSGRNTANRPSVRVRLEDLVLIASVVDLGWELVGRSAGTTDRRLHTLAGACARETHSQLLWLVRQLYTDIGPRR